METSNTNIVDTCIKCNQTLTPESQINGISFSTGHILCQPCTVAYIQLNCFEYLTSENVNKNQIKIKCPCQNQQCNVIYTFDDLISLLSRSPKSITNQVNSFEQNNNEIKAENINERIEKLTSNKTMNYKCYIHQEEDAYGYCCNCKIYFCEKCKNDFIKQKVNIEPNLLKEHINHQILVLNDIKNEIKELYDNNPYKTYNDFDAYLNEKEAKLKDQLNMEITTTKEKVEKIIDDLNSISSKYIQNLYDNIYHISNVFKLIKVLSFHYYNEIDNALVSFDIKHKYISDINFVFSDLKLNTQPSFSLLENINKSLFNLKDFSTLDFTLLKRDIKNPRNDTNISTIKSIAELPQKKLLTKTSLKKVQCEFNLKGHTWSVLCLKQLKNGLLASGSTDSTVKIWDLNGSTRDKIETPCFSFKPHSESITSIELYNNLLITGSKDKQIKVWKFTDFKNTPQLESILRGHSHGITKLLMDSNSNTLYSSSMDNSIIVWDMINYKEKFSLKGHKKYVYDIILLDDNHLISSSYKEIKIWDIKNKKEESTLTGHDGYIYSMVLIDSNTLITGSNDRTIVVWDLLKKHILFSINAHRSAVQQLILYDENKIITASWDKSIGFFEYEKDSNKIVNIGNIYGHTNEVLCLCNLDNGLIASGSDDNIIKIWNLLE